MVSLIALNGTSRTKGNNLFKIDIVYLQILFSIQADLKIILFTYLVFKFVYSFNLRYIFLSIKNNRSE